MAIEGRRVVQMRTARSLFGLAIIVGISVSSAIEAAERYDACIKVAGFNKAWRLDPGGGWKDVLIHTATVESASDLVVTAAAQFSGANTSPGTQVLYRIVVDGQGGSPHFRRRVPPDTPMAQNFSAVFDDVPQGNRTIRFQAKHAGGSVPVYYALVWMTPHLIDAAEASFEANSGATVTSLTGSKWTTIQSLQVSHDVGDLLAIGGSFRIVAGSPGQNLEYRFLSGSSQLFKYIDSNPVQMPDGVQLNRFFKPTDSATSRTISLQVRSPAGNPTNVQVAHLFVQTMPPYQLFEAGGASLPAITYDKAFHPVLETAWDFIDPISLGSPAGAPNQFRSWIGGFAFATLSPQDAVPTRWRFDIEREFFPNFNFDLGEQPGTPTNHVRLVTDIGGGCGVCGWFSSSRYRIKLSAKSECDIIGASSNGVARATTQLIMVPSTFDEVLNSCSPQQKWRDCCNSAPDCVWSCSTGALPLVGGAPNFVCP